MEASINLSCLFSKAIAKKDGVRPEDVTIEYIRQ